MTAIRGRRRTRPSEDPAYRRKLYAEKRAKMGGGMKREYTTREVTDYMPIAKGRVANDPLREWKRGPEKIPGGFFWFQQK